MTKEIPIEEMTYEQAFAALDAVVNGLETDKLPLDQLLALFERGQALARHCASLLDQAELKVNQLSGNQSIPYDPQA